MQNHLKLRRSYLDVLRILASFLVCFNHSDGFHIYLDQQPDGSIVSWLMVVISVITRVNIPLFMMITGALTLGKAESYRGMGKRISRFAVILLGASLVKYSVEHAGNFSLGNFARAVFSGSVNMSYWYLYAYMAYLMAQPFLCRIAEKLTGKDAAFLVMLRFVLVSVYPLLNYGLQCLSLEPIRLSGDLQLPLSVLNIFFYPLIGYYLANVLPVEQLEKKKLWLWVPVFVAGVSIASLVTYHEGVHAAFTQNYLGLFDYAAAMAVFVAARGLLEEAYFPEKLRKLLASWSGFTLGIYVMEPLLALFFYIPFFDYAYRFHPVIRLGFSAVWCLFIIAAGSLLTYLLRRIPGCKKLL